MRFTKKIKKQLKNKKKFLTVFVVGAICFGFGVGVAIATPYAPVANPGSNFQICTATVNQPASYPGTSATPTLTWNFLPTSSSSQQSVFIEIDDNNSFSSLEFSSGEIAFTGNSYNIPSGNLAFNTLYYWRIGAKDQFGSWTGWAVGSPFTTNPPTCIASYSYSCVVTNPPACEFDDCGAKLTGSAVCKKTDDTCGTGSSFESSNVCEANGVTCFAPSQICAVCPGGYKEATP